MSDEFLTIFLVTLLNAPSFASIRLIKQIIMKNILVLLMMLVSLQVYAGTRVNDQDNEPVNIELRKGHSTDDDTHPRTIIPITCVYAEGMVQLTFLGNVGEYTLTVTNQLTGERWSVNSIPVLQTSTASGSYWVEIKTEDGSMYYGTYTL